MVQIKKEEGETRIVVGSDIGLLVEKSSASMLRKALNSLSDKPGDIAEEARNILKRAIKKEEE